MIKSIILICATASILCSADITFDTKDGKLRIEISPELKKIISVPQPKQILIDLIMDRHNKLQTLEDERITLEQSLLGNTVIFKRVSISIENATQKIGTDELDDLKILVNDLQAAILSREKLMLERKKEIKAKIDQGTQELLVLRALASE